MVEALHRRHRLAEDASGLVVAESGGVAEHHDIPLVVGQPVERCLEPRHVQAQDRRRRGIVRRRSVGQIGGRLNAAGPPGAAEVGDVVPGDGEEPGGELHRLAPEPRQPLRDFHEHLRRHVFCEEPVPQPRQGVAEEPGVVTVEQRGKSRRITCAGSTHERFVVIHGRCLLKRR